MSMRKNLATLVSGNVLAQGILLLGLPVLSRFYEPQHFAGLAVIAALGSLFGMGSTFRYDMAIVLPDNHSDAASLFILSGAASLSVTLACLIIVLLFNVRFAELLGLSDHPNLTYLLPPAILAVASYSIFEPFMIRNKIYRYIAIAKLFKAVATVLIPLSLVFFLNVQSTGLIAGHILGFALAGLLLAFFTKLIYSHFFEGVDKHRIWQVACDYRKFPFFTLPQSFINNLSRALPNLLLASLYSPTVLGLFYLGFRAFTGPAGIITESMGKVFYQKVNQEYKTQHPIFPIIINLYKKLFILVLPPTIFLFVFAELVFTLIFGEDWSEAGRYLKFVLPWLMVMFVVSPSHYVLNVLNKQELFLFYDIISLGFRYGVLVIGAHCFMDPVHTIGLYSLVGMFGNIIIATIILREASIVDRRIAGSEANGV